MIARKEKNGKYKKVDITTYRNLRLGVGKVRKGGKNIAEITDGEIESVLEKMAIIVPTKDENPKMLEKVLRSVPGECLIVVASASTQQYPKEIHQEEREIVKQLNKEVEPPIIIVHQEDPEIAKIFKRNYPETIDARGLPFHGKAAGCIIGICAALCYKGVDFIGLIDGDNGCPLSVTEYVRSFACGVCLADNPDDINVRLRWGGKAYIDDVLDFRSHGNVSEITNRFLNLLIGNENELIETANAGEEAFSAKLLLNLPWGARFGMETEFLFYLLQKTRCEIQQMETISSHIHTQREDSHSEGMTGHTKEMIAESLEVFLSDPEVSEEIKKKIREEMGKLRVPRVSLKIYPPLKTAIKQITGELEKVIEII